MQTPKFSIVIPTYNRASLLIQTVDSLLNQSFKDFEILIVDDGGTDHTEQVINNIQDSRVHYFKVSNRERGAARNYGANHAIGDYINFFDSDDLAFPNHLATAAELIDSHASIDVFALSYEIQKPNGARIKSVKLDQPVQSFICEGNHLSCNGVFIKREVALQNPFSEIRELSGSEDYELWLRLSARFPFPCFPEISHAVIHHDERSTSNFNPAPLVLRKETMLKEAFKDEKVAEKYLSKKQSLYGSTYAYIALHLSLMQNQKKNALHWWIKGLSKNPLQLFSRRSAATLKHLLLP